MERTRDPLLGLFACMLASGCAGGASSGETTPPSASDEAPAVEAHGPTTPEAPTPPTAAGTFADGSTSFAVDFWKALGREAEGNLAVSPASISMALAMTWAGARGATADEMARTLHFGAAEETHRDASAILARWNAAGERPYELRVVNRLFADRSLVLEPPYVALTRDRYGAPIESVDFAGAPDRSRVRINDFIEEATNDRIEDLLPPGSVDASTRLVLANAVYFLGKWEVAFDREATRDAEFRAPGRALQVPTMHRTGTHAYAEVDGVRLLELSYRGGDFAMLFVLPDADDGLPALERELSAERLRGYVDALEEQQVRVALPRFEIDPPSAIPLKRVLTSMGMRLAFSGEADFSGMATGERFAIGEVFHEAFVKVDEEGTEAAAATAVVMVRGAARPQPMPAFIADHPFLFVLRDVRTGAILFLGRVVDPS